MIKKYELGLACTLNEGKGITSKVVGKIVGTSVKGSVDKINGIDFPSIILFSTPHGSIFETGIMHLNEMTDKEQKELYEYEKDVLENGKLLYGGRLSGFGLMAKVKNTCNNQTCCLDCPLFTDNNCFIVKIPFTWDLDAIEKAIKAS